MQGKENTETFLKLFQKLSVAEKEDTEKNTERHSEGHGKTLRRTW